MIRIAIQSKGRLNEESLSLLQSIGIEVDAPKRKLLSKSQTFPIEALYLRDDDIPQVVAGGTATLGIVGLNEVEERGADVSIVSRLGFGACRLSLAVPKGENYEGIEWFEGRRIATSYPNILQKYLVQRGINAKVEVITGSVEIAPAVSVGVFASRSPFRPNGLGLSCVKIDGVDPENGVIRVSGADLADGTPVYDIKPYVEYADSRPGVRSGFVDDSPWELLEVSVPEEIASLFPAGVLSALKQILAADPRPSYQDDPEREYGLTFAGRNVKFKVSGKVLTVTGADQKDSE